MSVCVKIPNCCRIHPALGRLAPMQFLTRIPTNPTRLGILPGSFNPPTQAHLALALAALANPQAGLDEVVLVLPSAFPHKTFDGATFTQRAQMLRVLPLHHPITDCPQPPPPADYSSTSPESAVQHWARTSAWTLSAAATPPSAWSTGITAIPTFHPPYAGNHSASLVACRDGVYQPPQISPVTSARCRCPPI